MNERPGRWRRRYWRSSATLSARRPRQVVPEYVDWKDVDYLRQFVPERGKIMPRRISGISAKDQRRIAQGDQACTLDGNAAVRRGLSRNRSP